MKQLRVLIATYDLSLRGGTQMYVGDLANGLLRRGHTPIVYSTQLGDIARQIRERTIAVTAPRRGHEVDFEPVAFRDARRFAKMGRRKAV